jgi:hypothetical protein
MKEERGKAWERERESEWEIGLKCWQGRDENIRNIFANSQKAISYVYLYGNLEVDI